MYETNILGLTLDSMGYWGQSASISQGYSTQMSKFLSSQVAPDPV
jgi:hypothetical protein